MTLGDVITHAYDAWLSIPGRWSEDELALLAAWTISSIRGSDEWSPFQCGEA